VAHIAKMNRTHGQAEEPLPKLQFRPVASDVHGRERHLDWKGTRTASASEITFNVEWAHLVYSEIDKDIRNAFRQEIIARRDAATVSSQGETMTLTLRSTPLSGSTQSSRTAEAQDSLDVGGCDDRSVAQLANAQHLWGISASDQDDVDKDDPLEGPSTMFGRPPDDDARGNGHEPTIPKSFESNLNRTAARHEAVRISRDGGMDYERNTATRAPIAPMAVTSRQFQPIN
jgi:hypothetical protein